MLLLFLLIFSKCFQNADANKDDYVEYNITFFINYIALMSLLDTVVY